MNEIFRQHQARYQQLCAARDAGRLSPQQFQEEVQKLRWMDESGAWWAIEPRGGAFLRYDGARWIAAQPPQAAAPPPLPPDLVSQPAPGQEPPSGRKKIRALIAATPILALAPSVLCGGLWFLYTSIGVFKSEGLQGVDWVTPLIVIGLPLLAWIFKKKLDEILLPFKPAIVRMPRPLRMGISLAVPVVFGCGCSLASYSGYFALNAAAFISIITASVLMRY